jgi:hypothetical protein
MIMKKNILLLFLLMSASTSFSQSDNDEIMKVVNGLFSAMKASNEQGINACFTEAASMQSMSVGKDGKIILSTFLATNFAAGMAKRAVGAADERVITKGLSININNGLASAWVPYEFYLDNKFSHCGIDIFTLVKKEGQWKISNLTYNMIKDGCAN